MSQQPDLAQELPLEIIARHGKEQCVVCVVWCGVVWCGVVCAVTLVR